MVPATATTTSDDDPSVFLCSGAEAFRLDLPSEKANEQKDPEARVAFSPVTGYDK